MRSIQVATKDDLPIIQHIATLAYHATYIPILGNEQVDYMLKMIYSLDSLAAQMDQGHRFLVVLDGGKAVGFASFNSLDESSSVYKLQKLYVLPAQHGAGLGRYLINEVIAHAQRAGAGKLQLNVNRFNKARGFYEKLGFEVKEQVDIPIGEGYFMNDYVMEREISFDRN